MASKGGKRPGAGRKPSTIKGIAKKLPKESAELLLSEINANSKWVSLANSADERIQLETLKYLTDRAYGKARQAIEASGVMRAELGIRTILLPAPVESTAHKPPAVPEFDELSSG